MPVTAPVWFVGHCDGCDRDVKTYKSPTAESPASTVDVFCAECDGPGDLPGKVVTAYRDDPVDQDEPRTATDGGSDLSCPHCGELEHIVIGDCGHCHNKDCPVIAWTLQTDTDHSEGDA